MTASVAASRAPSQSRSRSRSRLRTLGILAVAAVVAVGLNAVVAAVANALGAPAGYGPLTLPAYALFTVLGIAAGWAGWVIVRHRARDAGRVLAVLVPVVTVVSLVPDVLLLVLGFIPGTTPAAAIALMVMHLVVVAVAVPAYVLASRRA
ncbi:DUF6069 family protein [Cnuibacter sp. UC19_7]|uniref:DUF6069 family protein n=1 Tax=Cnuibacter sp. UC19_7 TaxID=3350166 RepID=UPI00367140B4